jgi:ATP-binding cassette, subfamily B, bacterial MsbA
MYQTLKSFWKLAPISFIIICISLILINILEGLGIGMIVPVFQQLTGSSGQNSKLSSLLDTVFNTLGVSSTLINTLIILSLLYVCRGVMTLIIRYAVVSIASRMQYQLKKEVYRHVLRTKIEFWSTQKQGTVINTIITESNRAASALYSAAQWATSISSTIMFLGVAFFISGKLAIAAGIIGIVSMLPLKLIAKRAVLYGNKISEINEKIQNDLLESIYAIKVLKGASLEENVETKFDQNNRHYKFLWQMLAFNANSISIYSQPIGVVILSIILYISVNQEIPFTDLMVFLFAFMRLMPTISALHSFRHDLNNNLPGYQKVKKLIELSQLAVERSDGDNIPKFSNSIEIKNVSFAYIEGQPVLQDINLVINAGETIALLGRSGGGKSTLVDMILGFYETQNGTILVDGKDIRSIRLKSWRKQLAYVTQETLLFHDTVRNNLTWGKVDIDENKIVEYAKLAGAHDFILNLENGYDTVIGDRGNKLSGGQKQRIALARALLMEPKVLILDEATSALDHQNEQHFKESIIRLKKEYNMTIIMIAHRYTTIKDVDHIYVLDSGRIVEQGNWKELSTKKEGYLGGVKILNNANITESVD